MRGSPSCGKSTLIREHELEPYTISSDAIRLLFQSPVLEVGGKIGISQKHNRRAWNFLFERLEEKMTRGELVVIDATHKTTEDVNRYRQLCEKYRYRCTVCDFSDMPLDVVLNRNSGRPFHQRLSQALIESYVEIMPHQKLASWVTVVKPNELRDVLTYRPEDYNAWKKVHHIGDLQGCYQPLADYFAQHGSPTDNPDELYIFVGDLVDRGIQNAEVMKLMLSIYTLDNVKILEGNHEIHLQNWAEGSQIRSEIFRNETQPELEAADISKKSVKSLYRRLRQMIFYVHNDVKVLVTHGGLCGPPGSLMNIATTQLIKGVGEHHVDIDTEWNENIGNTPMWQVHGHRNHQKHPIQVGYSLNLEGKIEFFGHLRVAVLEGVSWKFIEIESKICKELPHRNESALLRQLRTNKYVVEKEFGDVSSFNFSRDAFHSKKWNETTIKARGIFINTKNNEIVARSYDKFFNVGEMPNTTWEELEKNLVFPVKLYRKENGFLGITGWDKMNDCKIIASKSSLTGDFAGWFSDILLERLGNKADAFFQLLNDEKLSAVFEVIDPENDPHMVEYFERDVILLDLVYRSEQFDKVSFEQLTEIATTFGLSCKKLMWYCKDITELKEILELGDALYKIEGLLLEDVNGFMTKVKFKWYSHWKQMRNVKEGIAKGWKTKPQYSELSEVQYMESIPLDLLNRMSIIDVRNSFIVAGGLDVL